MIFLVFLAVFALAYFAERGHPVIAVFWLVVAVCAGFSSYRLKGRF